MDISRVSAFKHKKGAKKKDLKLSPPLSIMINEDLLNLRLEELRLSTQLPSGIGNPSLKKRLQEEQDSNPPSNYNSDTDEPKPRKRDRFERVKHEVVLDQDFISPTNKHQVSRDDFQPICVLGRGA